LQEFLTKHADDTEAFGDPSKLKRKDTKPASATGKKAE